MSAALMLALAFGSPAAAAVVIKDSGTHGDWGTNGDDQTTPGAKCGYSAADSSGTAHLRWIKAFPVFAGTSPGVSQQPITWRVLIQKSQDGGATWQNITSTSETRTAISPKSAKFDPIKINVNGSANGLYRAVATLTWMRNGNVTGYVKFRMEFYSVKWTVGDPSYVYQDACDGAAD